MRQYCSNQCSFHGVKRGRWNIIYVRVMESAKTFSKKRPRLRNEIVVNLITGARARVNFTIIKGILPRVAIFRFIKASI